MSDGDNSNKGKSKVSLEDALKDAAKNAATTGLHTVAIAIDIGNPSIKEYRVKITLGG